MTSNAISVDPRIINPLVCNPDDGPGRFARDTLNRCASALQLFGNMIGSNDVACELLQEDDHRFVFALQLEGIAETLRAVSDALDERNGKEGAR